MTAPEDRTGVGARLDAIEAAHKGATGGEWSVDDEYPGVVTSPGIDVADCFAGTADAAAIVAEHNNVAWLVAAVRGVLALADEWNIAAELHDAAALDAQARFDLMAEGGHLIEAGDARRFADRLRATVAAALGEA